MTGNGLWPLLVQHGNGAGTFPRLLQLEEIEARAGRRDVGVGEGEVPVPVKIIGSNPRPLRNGQHQVCGTQYIKLPVRHPAVPAEGNLLPGRMETREARRETPRDTQRAVGDQAARIPEQLRARNLRTDVRKSTLLNCGVEHLERVANRVNDIAGIAHTQLAPVSQRSQNLHHVIRSRRMRRAHHARAAGAQGE